jgi:transcription elongation factor GreA
MEALISRLRAGEALGPSIVREIDAIVAESEQAGTLGELQSALPEPGPDERVEPRSLRLLRLLVSIRLVRDDHATESILKLLEQVNQSGDWPTLAQTAGAVLDVLEHPDVCRYIARAAEQAGLAVLPQGALDRALELTPENHRLLWLKGLSLEEAGADGANACFAEALHGWIRARDLDKVEETILRILEAPEKTTWELTWDGLDQLARAGEVRPLVTFAEFAMEEIESLGLAGRVWTTLRRLLESGEKSPEIRRLAARAVEGVHRKVPSFGRIVDLSGLSRADVPARKALLEFDRLLKFAPGLLVVHGGFGIGTIRDNDGETLVIDFPRNPGHRMSLAIAERSLDILPPDDLRTLIMTDPDALAAMKNADPVALLVLALRKAGGEGSSADLRKVLVPDVVSSPAWPSWWKRAAVAAEDDPRIDTSQTFRKLWRLPGESEAASLLPRLEERADLHKNLETIHRFLVHHKGHEEEARRVYRPRLAHWLGAVKRPEARLHILNGLRRWDPGATGAFADALRTLLEGGGDFSFTSLAEEQMDLLLSAESIGLGVQAALAAFPSRHDAVRLRAAEILRKEQGEHTERFIRELLSRAPQDETRVLGLIEHALTAPDTIPEALADPWLATRAVIAIVHGAAREPHRRDALGLLKPDGALGHLLAKTPLDDEARLLVVQQLSSWRASDRYLFPILELLARAGADAAVEDVRRHRAERSAELVSRARAAADSDSAVMMTRASLRRLSDEIQEIESALRTEIPETIRRARELGDLRENAEYEAAKLKQQQLNQRLRQLQEMIAGARAIEDLAQPDGVSGPGTEVVVLDLADGREDVYWILGEGDSHHGEHVVSYRAPLGAALVGRRVGERVTVRLNDRQRELEILDVRRRLP